MSGTIAKPDRLTRAPSRAARELDLRRGEFDLAVNPAHPDPSRRRRRRPTEPTPRPAAYGALTSSGAEARVLPSVR